MTRVAINSGICGFSTTVTVERARNKKVRIILETECEVVMKMQEDIKTLDAMSLFSGFLNNPVIRCAAQNLKHAACPVPSGILKAVEVEAGLCLPKNAAIVFIEGRRKRKGEP
jgi:hypothetical protein